MHGPWVVGALINQQWSVAGWGHKDVNSMLIQPFVNYNLPDGWYLTSPTAARRCSAARRTRSGRAASASRRVIRWPASIKPGTIINDIGAHEDMIPTLLAAAGDTSVKEDLLTGRKIGDMTYKVHLDGYNLMPFFKGEVKESPRHEFIYWTDGGSVAALRYNNWKITFLRQNSAGYQGLGDPVRGAALADAHQSAHGSVRARLG